MKKKLIIKLSQKSQGLFRKQLNGVYYYPQNNFLGYFFNYSKRIKNNWTYSNTDLSEKRICLPAAGS